MSNFSDIEEKRARLAATRASMPHMGSKELLGLAGVGAALSLPALVALGVNPMRLAGMPFGNPQLATSVAVGTVGSIGAVGFALGKLPKLLNTGINTAVGLASKVDPVGLIGRSGGLVNTARDFGGVIEFGARGLLTGSANPFKLRSTFKELVHGNPTKAWFPSYGTGTGIGRFALNPKITGRLIGLSAIAALGAGVSEAMIPKAPPPSLYFDGVHMRNNHDMGADANLAQSLMGSASGFNSEEKRRILTSLFT